MYENRKVNYIFRARFSVKDVFFLRFFCSVGVILET